MYAPPPAPARKSFVMQRLKPALALATGFILLLFNAVYLVLTERFFVFGLYLGMAMTFAAGFHTVVGEPEDIYGNRPMWFKVVTVAAVIVGLLLALVLHIELTVE